jgi:hypothetical protein
MQLFTCLSTFMDLVSCRMRTRGTPHDDVLQKCGAQNLMPIRIHARSDSGLQSYQRNWGKGRFEAA